MSLCTVLYIVIAFCFFRFVDKLSQPSISSISRKYRDRKTGREKRTDTEEKGADGRNWLENEWLENEWLENESGRNREKYRDRN